MKKLVLFLCLSCFVQLSYSGSFSSKINKDPLQNNVEEALYNKSVGDFEGFVRSYKDKDDSIEFISLVLGQKELRLLEDKVYVIYPYSYNEDQATKVGHIDLQKLVISSGCAVVLPPKSSLNIINIEVRSNVDFLRVYLFSANFFVNSINYFHQGEVAIDQVFRSLVASGKNNLSPNLELLFNDITIAGNSILSFEH